MSHCVKCTEKVNIEAGKVCTNCLTEEAKNKANGKGGMLSIVEAQYAHLLFKQDRSEFDKNYIKETRQEEKLEHQCIWGKDNNGKDIIIDREGVLVTKTVDVYYNRIKPSN